MESSYVFIDGLRFYAYHGVDPQENRVGADYEVSIRVGYDFSKAMEDDCVGHTLNYASLFNKVKEEMGVPSKLVEHVAGRIARRIFADFPGVSSLDLKLTKCNPPMGACCSGAGVELHLINDKT